LIANWKAEIARFAPFAVYHDRARRARADGPKIVAATRPLRGSTLVITTYAMIGRTPCCACGRVGWRYWMTLRRSRIPSPGRQRADERGGGAGGRDRADRHAYENSPVGSAVGVFDFLNPVCSAAPRRSVRSAKKLAEARAQPYGPLAKPGAAYILRPAAYEDGQGIIADALSGQRK